MFPRRLAIWPTLPLNVHFRKASNWLPYPLNDAGCRIFSRARHAIWNACAALGLGSNDVVLVPAYHHGSEVEALLRAGVQIRYYELTDLLEPDPESLEAMLAPEVSVLYLIHYLGFPQDAVRWRQWCDERDLLLFEDAAQAFLTEVDNKPVGSFGHAGVFCLYKTYGIPDGGAVIAVRPAAFPATAMPSGRWGIFKRHVNWVAERWGGIGALHLFIKPMMKRLKKKSHNPHKEFELGEPSTPPSAMTMRLLPKLVNKTTAEQRRENYTFLLTHLRHLVPRPFVELPEGACPFAFPVEVTNADEVLGQLRRYGVVGILFWRNPHPSLPVMDFPVSRAFRNRVFAIPVHQELTRSELQQIVEAVLKATKAQETKAQAARYKEQATRHKKEYTRHKEQAATAQEAIHKAQGT
jgi:dTDP-4-amino-4,6-dideoxygalactose transaminase